MHAAVALLPGFSFIDKATLDQPGSLFAAHKARGDLRLVGSTEAGAAVHQRNGRTGAARQQLLLVAGTAAAATAAATAAAAAAAAAEHSAALALSFQTAAGRNIHGVDVASSASRGLMLRQVRRECC